MNNVEKLNIKLQRMLGISRQRADKVIKVCLKYIEKELKEQEAKDELEN